MNKTDRILASDNEIIIELVDMFGIENTQKFIDMFGRNQMYIPQMKNISKEYRNQNIYKDFLSGMSYIKLSNKYELNEISLKRIIKSETQKRKAVSK